MAPTRPNTKNKNAKAKAKLLARKAASSSSSATPKQLLVDATRILEQGDRSGARRVALEALDAIGSDKGPRAGAALTLLGEICIEMGDEDAARDYFSRASATDLDPDHPLPDDMGGGAEKFLWLAQLSEEGGLDSVRWFDRGAQHLRADIAKLDEVAQEKKARKGKKASSRDKTEEKDEAQEAEEVVLEEKKRKLAETLCAVAEVYMTDLSWEDDAEQRCEALVTEASLMAPGHAETWQTLANVRISQARTAEARAALERSMALWTDLLPEDPAVPPFPTRVSLARLLMEVEMEEKAVEVAERLVSENDSSVEVWYLGGYGLYTIGAKQKEQKKGDDDEWKATWKFSRQWLSQCLLLFQAQEYEDVRLGEHATELLQTIQKELGEPLGDEGEDDGWEDTDEDGDEDEEMQH